MIHWRRGDQILRRCKTMVDRSINCAPARALVERIKKTTNDSIIYIATNERNESELAVLRSSGFRTFQDLIITSEMRSVDVFFLADPDQQRTFPLFSLANYSVLDIVVVEVAAMLIAPRFLAWGVSEMDDIVQFERMRNGRSFCASQESYPVSTVFEITWCVHHLGLFPINWNKVIFPAATPALASQQYVRSVEKGYTQRKHNTAP